MEKKENKWVSKDRIMLISIIVLLILLMYYKLKASYSTSKLNLLEGQLLNMKDQNAGLLRLVNEQAFNLGKYRHIHLK